MKLIFYFLLIVIFSSFVVAEGLMDEIDKIDTLSLAESVKNDTIEQIDNITITNWLEKNDIEIETIKSYFDFYEKEKIKVENENVSGFITHIPKRYNFTVRIQDKLSAYIEQLSSTEFLLFPIIFDEKIAFDKDWNWKLCLNYSNTYKCIKTEQLKDDLEKGIYFSIPEGTTDFFITLGQSSTLISASSSSSSDLLYGKNLCRTSSGRIHLVYLEYSDPQYCQSDDDGSSWSCEELTNSNSDDISITCYDNVSILVYFFDDSVSDRIEGFRSTDDGDSFGSAEEIANELVLLAGSSCDSDSNNVIHCAYYEGASEGSRVIYYRNDSGGAFDNTQEEVDEVNTDYVRLKIDSNNNPWILGTSRDEDDIILWNQSSGWGDSNKMIVFSAEPDDRIVDYGSSFDMIIKKHNGKDHIVVIFKNESHAILCNSTTDNAIALNTSCNLFPALDYYEYSLGYSTQGYFEMLESRRGQASGGDLYRYNTTDFKTFSSELLVSDTIKPTLMDSNFIADSRIKDIGYYNYVDYSDLDLYFGLYNVTYLYPNITGLYGINVSYNSGYENWSLAYDNLTGFVEDIFYLNNSHNKYNNSWNSNEPGNTNVSMEFWTNNITEISPGNLIGWWDFNTFEKNKPRENTGIWENVLGIEMQYYDDGNITIDKNSRFERGIDYSTSTETSIGIPNGLTTEGTDTILTYLEYINLTTCAWVNLTGYQTTGGLAGLAIFSNQWYTSTIDSNTSHYKVRGIAKNESGDTKYSGSTDRIGIINEFCLVCHIRNDTHHWVSVHSAEASTGSFGSPVQSLGLNTSVLEIRRGGICTSGVQFTAINGSCDEVFLFNATLTNEQITNIYNNGWILQQSRSYTSPVNSIDMPLNSGMGKSRYILESANTVNTSYLNDYSNVTWYDSYVPGESCTYTSGNWVVNCADDCNIVDAVDVGGNDISITGTGTFTTSAVISNFNLLTLTGTDAINRCVVTCNGACFES